MLFSNKNRFILFSIAAITLLLLINSFQVYAAPNQQKVPTLVVFVHVINDDGGTMNASDFAVTVTAKDPSPAIFSGSETGTTVTMKNSPYQVTELSVKGYKTSYSPGCSGRINNNEAKTCVITNDDLAPQLKVIKHVINDDGGTAVASDFWIYLYGNNPVPNTFPGSEEGVDVKISPGYYSVNEYLYLNYNISYSTECYGLIEMGDNKTCIITNNDRQKAQLVVIKKVINDEGGLAESDDFTLHVNSNGFLISSFPGSEKGTNVTIYEGYYSVFEDYVVGYSTYSTDCYGIAAGGETKICTITNDDVLPAHINVIKHVINDNNGNLSAPDFTIYISGSTTSQFVIQGSENGTDITIYPGYFNIFENYYYQYFTSYSDGCNGFIYSGENRTCTITNNDNW